MMSPKSKDDNPLAGWTMASRRKPKGKGFSYSGDGGYEGMFSSSTSVYVDILPNSMDEEWLYQLFSPYGELIHSVIPKVTNSMLGLQVFHGREDKLKLRSSQNINVKKPTQFVAVSSKSELLKEAPVIGWANLFITMIIPSYKISSLLMAFGTLKSDLCESSQALATYGVREVICIDELTANSLAFDKGRVFIVTERLDCINETIHLTPFEDLIEKKKRSHEESKTIKVP
ncbi:hypothetical protein C3L33_11809, partial [Rhododendron williamsianum]